MSVLRGEIPEVQFGQVFVIRGGVSPVKVSDVRVGGGVVRCCVFHKGPGAHPVVADDDVLSGVGADEEREDLRGASS
eukprot:4764321-Heterocapsa_arctica.AAC.1